MFSICLAYSRFSEVMADSIKSKCSQISDFTGRDHEMLTMWSVDPLNQFNVCYVEIEMGPVVRSTFSLR